MRQETQKKMRIEMQADGKTKEIYDTPLEFRQRGLELGRTMGRRQMTYEGWMNGQLIRIY